ncbi:MAG: type II secretion system ATPase GspE [Betaproteobacteria bacterium]|nr:MAG: type II secretion system ATPase GspE [Betaproteobacteria bacterium]
MTQQVPYAFARSQRVLPAGERDGSLLVWVTERTSPAAITELRRSLASDLTPLLVTDAQFEEGLRVAYVDSGSGAASVVNEVESEVDLDRLMQDIPDVEDLLDEAGDAPIVRMLNAMLSQAVREGASDVHVEPFESHSVVRYRVDGTLRDVVRPRSALHAALVSRIKIMANMDIAEKRLPQDGRIMLRLGGRPIDVRVSTLPAAHGERIVLRLLDKERGSLAPEKLGMAPDTLESFSSLVRQSHGIVLVTGPTGSGKTTTLYAMLSRLDTQTTNVLTVEDPIEYDLPGIGQTQVNPRIDMTFARALRAILRQDPDVIMIGEIRDRETAQIAVQASLTGHLVLATLHTNDAVSAVTRLLDMEIEPFLLSSTLLGVLGQRLLRKLCTACREMDDDGNWHANGCPACSNSGYVGRTGAYELLRIEESMRNAIHAKEAEGALRALAAKAGFRSIREDCERWLSDGTTSLEEVTRISREQ